MSEKGSDGNERRTTEGSKKNHRKPGVEGDGLGYRARNAAGADSSPAWSAPSLPLGGMNAQELGQFQDSFTRYARGRILGIGATQYSDVRGQRFEAYSISRLIDEAQDELADVVNYAAMLAIALQRIKEKFVGEQPGLDIHH